MINGGIRLGRQVNYWMDYENFLIVAQTALDEGCIIIKEDKEQKKVLQSRDISIVTSDCKYYYFYLPEAGYSFIHNNMNPQIITRSRIYVSSGYYQNNGWMEHPECLTKVYNKITRVVKKAAPYTEFADKYKRYISSTCLELVEKKGYHLYA